MSDKALEDNVFKAIALLKQKKEQKENEKILSKTKFAGEEFAYEKEITEKEEKLLKQKEKNKTHKDLDALVDGISKKKDINIFDKTKVDWETYVEKNQLSKELDYIRKDGYLSKKRFIEETNLKLMVHKKEEERRAKYLSSIKK